MSSRGEFRLGLHRFGNVVVGVQPARGYNIDPKSTYHDPDLVPPHHYLAFYLWLRHEFDLHAVVHLGKHGNLEWLPGKSTGLSADCLPDAVLGPLPHLYPFIVNDPGEGIQAKRRASAVIIDHLTPPMTRAELHDDLARLETLVDEYALAADLDPKRATVLAEDILSLARAQRLDADVNVTRDTPTNEALRALDAHLCDLKEMQIRDGLHVFGRVPADAQRNDLIVSIARLPRSDLKAAGCFVASGACARSRPWRIRSADPRSRRRFRGTASRNPCKSQHRCMAHSGRYRRADRMAGTSTGRGPAALRRRLEPDAGGTGLDRCQTPSRH